MFPAPDSSRPQPPSTRPSAGAETAPERVARLRESVRNGTYVVDPDALAGRLLACPEARLLLGLDGPAGDGPTPVADGSDGRGDD